MQPSHSTQQAHRGGRPDRVSARLQARLRGHHLEARGLAVPIWSIAGLDQTEEPQGSGTYQFQDGLAPVMSHLNFDGASGQQKA
jgi:hypothetical protein